MIPLKDKKRATHSVNASQQNNKKLDHFDRSTAESILMLAQAANEVQKSSVVTATQQDAIEAHRDGFCS